MRHKVVIDPVEKPDSEISKLEIRLLKLAGSLNRRSQKRFSARGA